MASDLPNLRDLSLSASGNGASPSTTNPHRDTADETDSLKYSMQQDALLRSRLLSTFHTETKGRRGSGLAGLNEDQLSPVNAPSLSIVPPPPSNPGDGGGGRGGAAAAAASAGGRGDPFISTPTAGGPLERYSTLDLFPDYPEQFLPQVQDFQRIIILNTPEPPDSDTQTACKQLRKGMKLRSKWLGIPLEPETLGSPVLKKPGGEALPSPTLPTIPSTASLPSRSKSDSPPSSPSSPRTQAYIRMKRRAPPSYKPFFYVLPEESDHSIHLLDGVYHVKDSTGEEVTDVFPVEEFFNDYHELVSLLTSGPVKTYSYKRLQVLEARFHLHKLLNSDRELAAQKSVPHRDFYNIRKVDTHVHHSACMNLKHLLRFIKFKLKTCGGEIVAFRDGQFMTLKEVFQSLKITAMDLSVDTLDMHANNTFHRFDRFNLKYNPAGQSRLREIFLKTDNLIGGKYLAEVTQQVISDLDASKYQLVEWRVSIYGRKPSEWDKLARWFYSYRLASDKVRWLIQIPRLYAVYKATGEIQNFEQILCNIFAPLFEVSRDPKSNIPLATFLHTIVGFDCVDDESKPEIHSNQGQNFPHPKEWMYKQDPPYSYWCYYIYANIKSLNDFRRARGMSTFEFRPHCGEAGDPEHLVAAYLLADKINHGIVLRKIPGLQLLYYLSQIGIAMSPLSNNKLFLDYHRNPFVKYFSQGLNVSLSTDDPLMLHYTKDPLVEEYSVAAQVWRLSTADLCEIARNSVLQSGFEDRFKRHFIGQYYETPGAPGNDIRQTNVPDIRVRYRYEIWRAELDQVLYHDGSGNNRVSRRKPGGTCG